MKPFLYLMYTIIMRHLKITISISHRRKTFFSFPETQRRSSRVACAVCLLPKTDAICRAPMMLQTAPHNKHIIINYTVRQKTTPFYFCNNFVFLYKNNYWYTLRARNWNIRNHRLGTISPASRDKAAGWLCVHSVLARCTFET